VSDGLATSTLRRLTVATRLADPRLGLTASLAAVGFVTCMVAALDEYVRC
jgi:hypothetical protein